LCAYNKEPSRYQTQAGSGSGLECFESPGIVPRITLERVSENHHYRKLSQNQILICTELGLGLGIIRGYAAKRSRGCSRT
jgi:hypothetical protein